MGHDGGAVIVASEVSVIPVVLAFGFAAFFVVQAIRTPWHPEPPDGAPAEFSHVYRHGEYHPYRRLRAWGHARYLLFAAANTLIGLWAWRAVNLP